MAAVLLGPRHHPAAPHATSSSNFGGAVSDDAYGEAGKRPEPDHQGRVYAVDVSALKLREFTWDRYLDACEAFDARGAATPEAKAKLQEQLAAEGYDGIYVPDDVRHELVIFPASIHKVKIVER